MSSKSREGGRFFGAFFSGKYAPTLTLTAVKIMDMGLYEALFFIKPFVKLFKSGL